jgi:ribosome-associated protein
VLNTPSLPPAIKKRFTDKYANRLTTEGQIVIQSQRYRDQGRNVADCLDKLREMILTVAVAPIKRRPTRPTRGSQQRRLQNKKQRSEKKQSRRKPRMDD